MESEERERGQERGACIECGREVASGAERSYAFGARNQLCWTCALERGGSYDADRDAWNPPPDLTGLNDEAYGASPHEIRRGRRQG